MARNPTGNSVLTPAQATSATTMATSRLPTFIGTFAVATTPRLERLESKLFRIEPPGSCEVLGGYPGGDRTVS
jgi:hypothetical protein